MRQRGEKYWEWVDAHQHNRSHAEELPNGKEIDVGVRLSSSGAIQMFIGVYDRSGEAIFEEYVRKADADSLSDALLTGVERARWLASSLPRASSG
jgi:hypothetical protein